MAATSTYGVAYPLSGLDCGLPAPVSVNVIAPLRVAPLGEPTFVKRTVTVQLAPGASVAPVQLSDPATRLKK